MKKLTLITVITINYLLITINLFSQPCLPQGITFSTQAQIDNFQTNYPNCTEIEGDVEINGADITNLNGLSVLTSIGGLLRIEHNGSLASLTGLGNLTSIGGNIEIVDNDSLTSLTGLENVTSIGGDLRVDDNENLSSLSGLDNIDAGSINDLHIDWNPSLSTCDIQSLCDYMASPNGVVEIDNNSIGCNNPWEIANACGYILPCLPYGYYSFTKQTDIDNFADYCDCTELDWGVEIRGDGITNLDGLSVITSFGGDLNIIGTSLTNLSGLDNVTTLGGDILIYANNSLESLTGLGGLTSIEGNINIGYWIFVGVIWWLGNPLLNDLSGLDNLTFIGGDLGIYGNGRLKSITGLENLSSIEGDLNIGAPWNGWSHAPNDSLVSLTGLNNLISIGGDLGISNNNALTSLSGLENLNSVGGDLLIGQGIFSNGGNNSLVSLSALANLTYVGGSLRITKNASLTNLTGLENLTAFEGGLGIDNNESLTDLTSLGNVTSLGGYLEIASNDSLSSLAGLDNLTSIGGDFIIGGYSEASSNSSLINLTGLDNVTSIGGNFRISHNEALSSLTGLDNVQAETISDLIIYENSSLSSCEVYSVCSYLSSPNGSIDIHDNAPGCNTQQEVEDNCFYCLPEGITFSTQEQIDSFQVNYPSCLNIQGDVTISGDDIINLNGLVNVTSIEGGLYIINNPVLTDIWSLANIDPGSIEGIYIFENASLSVCDIQSICDYLFSAGSIKQIYNNAPGCNNLAEVVENCYHHCLPEGISITTQAEIDSFQINYPDCADIDGALWIYGNTISNLNGLNNLTSIGGKLRMINNYSLTSLSGLNNVSYIGENLEILNNDALSSLSGLDNLNLISSKLRIENCHFLSTLAGLDNLNTVGSTLKIYHNDALLSLEGLNNVNTIGGYLEIKSHDVLTSLSGLENVNSGSIHGLIINNNMSLASCAVESICDYLADPGGIIEIQNNAPGCNSPEEVQDSCLITSVSEIKFKDTFTISPNPMESTTIIKYTLHQNSPVTLKILDLSGRLVVSLVNEVQQQGEQRIDFNTTGLPAGIYFCVLKTNEGIQTKKIIKI